MRVKAKAAKKAGGKAKAPKKAPAGRRGRAPGPRDKDLEAVLTEVTAAPEVRHLDEWVQVECPYCGESFEVHVTSDEVGQTMYEDCHVCCRPVSLFVQEEEGELQVEAHRS